MLVREFIRDCYNYFGRELSFDIDGLKYSFVSFEPITVSYMSDVIAFKIEQSDKTVYITDFVDVLADNILDRNKKIVFLADNTYYEFDEDYKVKGCTHFVWSLKRVASAGRRVNNSKEPDILTSAYLKGHTCYCADKFNFDSNYAEYCVNINGAETPLHIEDVTYRIEGNKDSEAILKIILNVKVIRNSNK